MVRRGSFICIEGLDGCGKTTQAKLLVKRLGLDYRAIYTAEPSKGRIGTFIKDFCLHREKRLSSVVEALLFAADRFEHVENEVLPAILSGKIVVSDRYFYSSLAYQGAAGLDLEWIETINQNVLYPDLSIFVDVDPLVVMGRLRHKKSVMETLENQRRVREIYLRSVKKGDLLNIDGNRSINEVAEDILTVVMNFLEKNS